MKARLRTLFWIPMSENLQEATDGLIKGLAASQMLLIVFLSLAHLVRIGGQGDEKSDILEIALSPGVETVAKILQISGYEMEAGKDE